MRRAIFRGWVAAGLAASMTAWAAVELASVNGRSITESDLKLALSGNYNDTQRDRILSDKQQKLRVLDGVINQELLVQQAAKENIEQSGEYKRALEVFRRQTLATLLVERKIGSRINDAAAKKYYRANKSQFSTGQVHAMHILVDDEGKAKSLLAMARKGDTDFQKLAEKHSIAPNVENNRGDLGYFGRSDMVSEFADAAFKAKEGEIIGPVKTVYGYHVIRVVDKKPGKPLEYHEVELQVKNALRRDLMQEYVGKLRSKAKVKVNKTAFR